MREIVGVVGDSHLISLSAKPKPQIYVPHQQFAVQTMSLFVRTENDPRGIANALRNAIAELDKDVPLYRERLLTDYFSASSHSRASMHCWLVCFPQSRCYWPPPVSSGS